MSVLLGKRQESKVQFLETARNLEIFTLQHCAKFPKRYAYTITNNIINLSISIYNELKSANSIFPTNKDEAQLRKNCLIKANCDLQAFMSQLDIARAVLNDVVSVSIWCTWLEYIEEEAKLISAVRKADKERYKNLPDRA